MAWNNCVESLRKVVNWECKDIPSDLVLAIINNESGGQIGIKAKVKCKAGDMYDASGKRHSINRAMGLMQAIPATVQFYNDSAPAGEKALLEDMTGTDERAARLQVRVGCKFLAFVNHYLHTRMPKAAPAAHLSDASPDQIKLVLTGYAVGHGATRKKLMAVKEQGYPPTFDSIKRNFPEWGKRNGKWFNRPIFYAEKVFAKYSENKAGGVPDVVKKPVEIVKRTVSNVDGKGAFIAVAFLAGAGWLLNRYFTKPRGNNADS